MRLKRIAVIIPILFLLIAGPAGCGKKAGGPAEAPKVPVEVALAKRGNIVQPARVTGTVQAGTTVQVTAAMSGRLQAVLVKVGDKVTRGQVIARLESDDIEARLAQAQAALDQARKGPGQSEAAIKQAEAGVRQAEARLQVAEANLQRIQALYDQGAASRQQLEAADLEATAAREGLATARAALDSARAALAGSQAAIAAAAAGVRQAEVALENTYIKAPVSGQVAARLLEPGEMAGGPVVTLVTGGDLQVEIGVTEQDINYLQPGKEVSLAIPAATGETLKGKVTSASPAADERTRLFQVKVALVDPPAEVKPGMAATVTYTTREARDVLLVPKNAVLNRGGRFMVYTVVDGKAAGRVVSTGIEDEKNIEIRQGLTGQESIIVKGQDFVSEGQAVEIVSGGPGA